MHYSNKYTHGFIKSAGIDDDDDVKATDRAKLRRGNLQRALNARPSMQRWDRQNPQPQYMPPSTDYAAHRHHYQQWKKNVYVPWQQSRAEYQKRVQEQQRARQNRIANALNSSPYIDPSIEQPANMYTHLREAFGGARITRVAPNTYQADLKDLYIGMYKDPKKGQRNFYRMWANRAEQWNKRGGPGTYITLPHVPPRPRNKQIKQSGQQSSAPSGYLRIYTNRKRDDNAQVSYNDRRGLSLLTPSSIVTLPSQIVPPKKFSLMEMMLVPPAFSSDTLRWSLPRHQVQGHGLTKTVQVQPVGDTKPSNSYYGQGRYDFLRDMPVFDRADYIGRPVTQFAGAMMRFKPDATNAFLETPDTFDQAATRFMNEGYAVYDPKSNMVRMTKKYVDSAKVPDPDMQFLLTAWYRAKHTQAVPKYLPRKYPLIPWTIKKQYKQPQGYNPKQWLQDAQFYYRMSNNTKKLRDKYVG